jgi:hypothetical protein
MRHFAALLLMTSAAHAAPGLWSIPAPGDGALRATVESDLGKHHAFAPLSIAPDIMVGVAPDTALLLSTSRASMGRTGAGNGFCVVAPHETLDMQPGACTEHARGFGISALRALGQHFELRAGVDSPSSSPFTLAAAGGFVAHVDVGRWWLRAAPSVRVGLIERDAGNRERMLVPLYAGASFDRVGVHLRTGAEGAIATLGDTLAIPVGVGASIDVGYARIGAEASLDHAFGPQNTLAHRSASAFIELPFERIYR